MTSSIGNVIDFAEVIFNPTLHRREAFLPSFVFCVINPFNKKIFIMNELNFESIFTTIIPENLKLTESFSMLRFAKVTFQKLSILWPKFNLNDIIRHFCDVTTLT